MLNPLLLTPNPSPGGAPSEKVFNQQLVRMFEGCSNRVLDKRRCRETVLCTKRMQSFGEWPRKGDGDTDKRFMCHSIARRALSYVRLCGQAV